MKIINILFTIILTTGITSAQCFDPDETIWKNTWASCQKSQNPIADYGNSHWIQYDFGSVRRLSKSWVWNTNDPVELDRGFKLVKIDYSTDGNEWTHWGEMTFPKAAGEGIYSGFPGPDMTDLDAQYVLLTAVSNHGDASCSGLAEIKFNLMPGYPNVPVQDDDDDDGGDEDCADIEITEIIIDYVSAIEAFILWEVSEEIHDMNFIIEYREQGASDWEEAETNEFEIFAEDLAPGTTYEFRIAVDCEEVQFSDIRTFTTVDDDDDGNCEAVEQIWIQEMYETEALIGWEPVAGADFYIIEYRIIGDDEWLEDETDEPEIFLEELEPFTNYQFRVGVECPDYSIAWSEINNFVSDPRILTGTSDASEAFAENEFVRIYPNPTKGRFVFEYQSRTDDVFNFSIIGLNGKVFLKNVTKINQGENRITVDLTGFAPGTYILEGLTLGQRKRISKKVVKVRE